jgi:hypothetical protein
MTNAFEPRVSGYDPSYYASQNVIEEPEPSEASNMPVEPSETESEQTIVGPFGVWTFPVLTRARGLFEQSESEGLGVSSGLASAGHVGVPSGASRHGIEQPYQHVY